MSLLSRASAASSVAASGRSSEGSAFAVVQGRHGAASVSEKPREPKVSIRELRDAVFALVSPDEIAQRMTVHPAQARSEIRRACLEIFSEPQWRHVPEAAYEGLIQRVIDVIFGLGLIETLLADDEVTEIMINGTRSIYVERSGVLSLHDQVFSSDDDIRNLVDRIIGPLGRRIDESVPMVNARLPEGHRVHVIIPPLSLQGTVVTIRKFTRRVLSLEELLAKGSLSREVYTLLTWAVRARKSIAVSGGTGSGKTTLLNALSCVIGHDERIVTIEDSAELRFLEHPHVVGLEARSENAEGRGQVTIRDLVREALRMRPDRIVVGECRGGEAFDMLQAMNTGHAGSLTTLHANAPEEAISRLTMMVRCAADLPTQVIEASIGMAVDLIVQTARARDGSRFVSAIAECSFDAERERCVTRMLCTRSQPESDYAWHALPSWLDEACEQRYLTHEEVAQWTSSVALAQS